MLAEKGRTACCQSGLRVLPRYFGARWTRFDYYWYVLELNAVRALRFCLWRRLT